MESREREFEHRRRQLRARLRSLSTGAIMRGSVVERRRRCGKPNCACALDPAARHPGRYLSVHLEGRTQVVHLREADIAGVQAAIARYEALWEVVNALTGCELAALRRRGQERRRARRRRKG